MNFIQINKQQLHRGEELVLRNNDSLRSKHKNYQCLKHFLLRDMKVYPPPI